MGVDTFCNLWYPHDYKGQMYPLTFEDTDPTIQTDENWPVRLTSS